MRDHCLLKQDSPYTKITSWRKFYVQFYIQKYEKLCLRICSKVIIKDFIAIFLFAYAWIKGSPLRASLSDKRFFRTIIHKLIRNLIINIMFRIVMFIHSGMAGGGESEVVQPVGCTTFQVVINCFYRMRNIFFVFFFDLDNFPYFFFEKLLFFFGIIFWVIVALRILTKPNYKFKLFIRP